MVGLPSLATISTQRRGGLEIVACGFAPNLSLIGVDEKAIYVQTEAGALYRVGKASGTRTKLYTRRGSLSGSTLAPRWSGVRLQGDSIYFGKLVRKPTYANDEIVAIDTATPTTDFPRVVVADGMYAPVSAQVVDGDHVYWSSIVYTSDGAYGGPLVSAPLRGGRGQPLTDVNPSLGPLGIVGGNIYFFVSGDTPSLSRLARLPVLGGDLDTVVRDLAPSSDLTSAALCAEALYVVDTKGTPSAGTVSIVRYPFSGAAAEVVHEVMLGGEVDAGAPRELVVDGDVVYFVSRTDSDDTSRNCNAIRARVRLHPRCTRRASTTHMFTWRTRASVTMRRSRV